MRPASMSSRSGIVKRASQSERTSSAVSRDREVRVGSQHPSRSLRAPERGRRGPRANARRRPGGANVTRRLEPTLGASRQKARPGESGPGIRTKRQSRPSRPRRQRHPEGAARGLEPSPGAALNGPGQSRGHRRGPERLATGHRKENRGRGLVETRAAARVTWTGTPSGAVPVAGRASDPSHMPAHPPVITGPGGGTGRRARAAYGGTGRTVSQGP